MEHPPVDGRTLVRVSNDDAAALGLAGRWWLVDMAGQVWVALDRNGDGGRAMHEGAPWCPAGRHVFVPAWWVAGRRRNADATRLRRITDHVLRLARVA